MEPFDVIKEYKDAVCSQIRWKKAHTYIGNELEHHILDQSDAFIREGDDEENAIFHAIKEMGDPIEVGTLLDRTHRPKPQKTMIVLTLSLLLIGLLIHLFISYNSDYPMNLPKHLLATLIGTGLMFFTYYRDFTILAKYPKTIYISTIIITIYLLVFSREVNGLPFFNIMFISFSGTYMTLLYPLAFVPIMYITRNKGYVGLLISEISLLILIALATRVSLMNGVILTTISGVILISIGIYKNWFRINKWIGFSIVYGANILGLFIFLLYRYRGNYYYYINRLQLALNPSIEAEGRGYIGVMTKVILSNAKLLGRGIIPDEYALSFTYSNPILNKEYLLTYLISNMGWIVFLIIMAFLGLFIIKGFGLCLKQKSILGTLVSTAIMLTLTLETISYVIFNLGFQLIAPISLPLISYGNVAIVLNLGLIGIMLSVFREGDIVRDNDMHGDKKQIISWNNGRLIIDFNK